MSYNSTHTGSQIDAAVDAVAKKQDQLVSGTNIKTIENTSILGSGNLSLKDLLSLIVGTRNYVLDSADDSNSLATATTATYTLAETLLNSITYTLSFNCEFTTATTATTTFTVEYSATNGSGKYAISGNPKYNSTTKRYEFTFTFNRADDPLIVRDKIYITPTITVDSGTVILNNVKLEKSNIASDWTIAYEDIIDYVNTTVDNSEKEQYKDISEIYTKLHNEYYTQSDIVLIKENLEDNISDLQEALDTRITNNTTEINNLKSSVSTQSKYLYLDNDHLVLKLGVLQFHIYEDKIYVNNNNNNIATYQGDTTSANILSVESQTKYFDQWAVRKGKSISGKGYNLNDVWIGG